MSIDFNSKPSFCDCTTLYAWLVVEQHSAQQTKIRRLFCGLAVASVQIEVHGRTNLIELGAFAFDKLHSSLEFRVERVELALIKRALAWRGRSNDKRREKRHTQRQKYREKNHE